MGAPPAAAPFARSGRSARGVTAVRIAAVVPSYEGRDLLPACLAALAAQTRPFDAVVVADDGSGDGTAAWLAQAWPDVEVLAFARNRGFAATANAAVRAVDADWVALVNSDVRLDPDWLGRALAATGETGCAAVATKLVRPDGRIDDAGDALRRDGVCEQRGRGREDGPRFAAAGEVWGACAGAALYRRDAFLGVGAFAEGFRQYLEDADLALRLRRAGWTCTYVPARAVHDGGASSGLLAAPVGYWTARNTLLLVARHFPARWLPLVAYRQVAWLWAAARGGPRTLLTHVRGVAAGIVLVPGALRARRGLRALATVPIGDAVPARPWRGPRAGGHPEAPE